MATELRNLRIPPDEWEALGEYAKAHDLNRTAVVRGWIRERIDEEYFPTRPELRGQSSLFGDGDGV